MAKELFSKTRLTNKFLKDIEQWNEVDVNDYKRKVDFELSQAWTETVIVFALMFTVLRFVWAFIVTKFPKSMNEVLKCGIAITVYLILTLIIAGVKSNKNLKEFVSLNRGEVGHKGEPYYKKVLLMIPVSLVIGVVINVILWVLLIKDNLTVDKLGTMQPLICSILYPFFYYFSTFIYLVKLQKKACPVCGRFDSIVTQNIATYGKKQEGIEHITKTQTKKVGEESTVAVYSNGQTKILSSKPIYANIVVDEYNVEYGTVMSDYITYCQYCSYIKEGTEQKTYSTRVN